jgi:opacity protein-like surface antigen
MRRRIFASGLLAAAALAVAAAPLVAAPAQAAPTAASTGTVVGPDGQLISSRAPADVLRRARPTGPVHTLASCSYSTNFSQGFTFGGIFFANFGYAGHYSGLTVVPSTSQVTSSGTEAQCLLVRYGDYNPGGVDGVFGRNSQAAFHQFQTDMNNWFGAGLATGPGQDLPGPNAWKWLRWWEQ